MSNPSEFMCPISMDLMTDPVIGNDGHTYERAAITEWLSTNNLSPLTRRQMTLADIQPNFALRGAIERWRLSNEAIPALNDIPLIMNTKSFTATSRKFNNKMCLDIKTTHNMPMETVLIAVIDVSGSMDSSSTNKHDAEGAQFSRLDLVKHSMSTLAALLNSEYSTTPSSMGIVSFSSAANLVMPITKMDTVGLNNANTAITAIRSGGSTNIWDGLRIGLLQAQIAINHNPNANIQILLLTDGEPSPDLLPPLGIKSTLKRKMDALKGRVTISTFGFGYSLDADLLESICIQGNGTYGFIPDCSMVGTVFINWAAKALLTLSHHITIELPGDIKYTVGDIILGSSQSLVIPYQDLETLKITYDNGQEQTIPVTFIAGSDDSTKNAIYLNRLQTEMEIIKKVKLSDNIITEGIINLKNEIDSLDNATECMKDISCDIRSDNDNEGQIMKASSSNIWWISWGRNHCLSYFHALKLQQCVNFKDKVLQHFGSDEFKALQEKGIDIFSSLPVPNPSCTSNNGGYYGGGYGPNPNLPMNMSNYVNNSGGCFTGDCMVKMSDDTEKRVDELKKGDSVKDGHIVVAVLKTPVNKEVEMVVFTKGLKITPWHPIILKDDDQWCFPVDVRDSSTIYVDNYYNLVLETGHIIELNSHQVVTLGHGIKTNSVISHPYFGTQEVIDDLKTHPDWESGFLVMNPDNIVRSEETGLIQKI
jgi:Mg-chelatase subunit ChlD